MHFEDPSKESARPLDDGRPWYAELTRYHWFVLVVAALGWLFDTMDQQLFNLARRPAIKELITPVETGPKPVLTPEEAKAREAKLNGDIAAYSTYSTMIFMMGWAIGGLYFGVLGDKIGRAKTMLLTILLYSIFTGLSTLSVSFWDFSLYRFLTGLGVGGEFAVGVALVAEVMPDRARPFALGWVQALSAVGNMMAAIISLVLGKFEETGAVGSAWRWMFIIGTLPALLAIAIRSRLKEPERWKQAVVEDGAEGKPAHPKPGSMSELFGDPVLRRNTIVGMLLAFAGVVGLWGIGFFSFDLLDIVFRQHFTPENTPVEAINGKVTFWKGMASLVQNLGAFFGVYAFSKITHYTGRKPAFAVSFVMAMIWTAFTFWNIGRIGGFYDIFWMLPIMGFFQIALFGGYAIYFPELFPTRLRSTGTSFCYNVGRLVAAIGPLGLGLLTSKVFADQAQYGKDWPMRYACVSMCVVFVIGLIALPFAPETKGKPLPE